VITSCSRWAPTAQKCRGSTTTSPTSVWSKSLRAMTPLVAPRSSTNARGGAGIAQRGEDGLELGRCRHRLEYPNPATCAGLAATGGIDVEYVGRWMDQLMRQMNAASNVRLTVGLTTGSASAEAGGGHRDAELPAGDHQGQLCTRKTRRRHPIASYDPHCGPRSEIAQLSSTDLSKRETDGTRLCWAKPVQRQSAAGAVNGSQLSRDGGLRQSASSQPAFDVLSGWPTGSGTMLSSTPSTTPVTVPLPSSPSSRCPHRRCR
jgi:hypothetical protein